MIGPCLAPPQANSDTEPDTVGQRTQWADEVEAYARGLQEQLREMRMSKATRNPRVSVLRWALVTGGRFYGTPVTPYLFHTRSVARQAASARRGDRVVRVRVTVEVVDGPLWLRRADPAGGYRGGGGVTMIDLPVLLTDRFHVVKAEIVDIAPHLPEGTFAVHQTAERVQPHFAWGVTNVETGHAISKGWDREHAIACARARLATITPAQLRKLMSAVAPLVRETERRASNGHG